MHLEDRFYSAPRRNFLERFSVQSVDELPSINPEKMEDFKSEAEDEVQLRLNL